MLWRITRSGTLFVFCLVFLCAFILRRADYYLWQDVATGDFTSVEHKGIDVFDAPKGAGLRLAPSWSEWCELGGEKKALPVSNYMQISCRYLCSKNRYAAPGLRSITYHLHYLPFLFIPQRKIVSSRELQILKGKGREINGLLYPDFIPGFALMYNGCLQGTDPFINYLNSPDYAKSFDKYAPKGIVDPRELKILEDYGPHANYIVESPKYRDYIVIGFYYGKIYLPESGTFRFDISDADFQPYYTFLDSKLILDKDKEAPLGPILVTRQDKIYSVAINVEKGMHRLRFDAYNIGAYWNTVLPGLKMSLNSKKVSIGPLQYNALSVSTPVLRLRRSARFLSGLSLQGSIPKNTSIKTYVRTAANARPAPFAKGLFISTPRNDNKRSQLKESVAFIGWQAKLPRGSQLRISLRQSDDGLVWDEWREHRRNERLGVIKAYQQYKVEMTASASGKSPTIRKIGIRLRPLIKDIHLLRHTFDPSGDNEKREEGCLQWELELNTTSYLSLEIIDQRGIVICRPCNCKLMKPGKRQLSFYGIVDHVPLPQGDYAYRITAMQRGYEQPIAVRQGRFKVKYHLGNCRCRRAGGNKE